MNIDIEKNNLGDNNLSLITFIYFKIDEGNKKE